MYGCLNHFYSFIDVLVKKIELSVYMLIVNYHFSLPCNVDLFSFHSDDTKPQVKNVNLIFLIVFFFLIQLDFIPNFPHIYKINEIDEWNYWKFHKWNYFLTFYSQSVNKPISYQGQLDMLWWLFFIKQFFDWWKNISEALWGWIRIHQLHYLQRSKNQPLPNQKRMFWVWDCIL